jgi:hypothetical protein
MAMRLVMETVRETLLSTAGEASSFHDTEQQSSEMTEEVEERPTPIGVGNLKCRVLFLRMA